jgi:hypothetical protein
MVYVQETYPKPSRWFHESHHHGLQQEGIRDDPGVLQAEASQPIWLGEVRHSGLRPEVSMSPRDAAYGIRRIDGFE